jgi:hypothetical protein
LEQHGLLLKKFRVQKQVQIKQAVGAHGAQYDKCNTPGYFYLQKADGDQKVCQ